MSPVEKTEAWVRDFVLAHALCPFAARPYALGSVLTVALEGADLESCFHAALAQVQALLAEEPEMIETTLLVFPEALSNFEEFLDFLATFHDTLEEAGADELVQLAHFHPDYQFEDTTPNDPGNRTNRSPFPVIQLLRAESVAKAIVAHPDVEGIPGQNIAKMRALFGGEL